MKMCIFATCNRRIMKFPRLVLFICALAFAVQGCKKEDDDIKLYLSGSLELATKMPRYVISGQKYDFVPSGLSASDGTHVAYYFTKPITSGKDTIMSKKFPAQKYTYTVPDSLSTWQLTCVGYAEDSQDYYTSSIAQTFVVVDPRLNEGTLKGFRMFPGDETSEIRGDSYYTHAIGNTIWMRQNLAYIEGSEADGWNFGHPYYESDAMRTIFGSFYTWEEARKACPSGWHLPSDQEWVDLLKKGGAPDDLKPLEESPCGAGKLMDWFYFNGEKMWEYYRDVDVTNDLYLSAIPAGYAIVNDKSYDYKGYGQYAAFWTSDEIEGKGVYRYIYMESDKVFVDRASKTGFAASVRCVR